MPVPTGDHYKFGTVVCWIVYIAAWLGVAFFFRERLSADWGVGTRALPALLTLGYVFNMLGVMYVFRSRNALTLLALFALLCFVAVRICAGLFLPEKSARWDEADQMLFYLKSIFIGVPMAVLVVIFVCAFFGGPFDYSYLVYSSTADGRVVNADFQTGRWAWAMHVVLLLVAWYWLQLAPFRHDLDLWNQVTGQYVVTGR
jgi:hypothetical protein